MSQTAMPRALTILLVEDDPGDALMIEEALLDRAQGHALCRVADGLEALEWLRTRQRPDLVILDLNMPRMDGREFLSAMKAEERWRTIPVVVLTTSAAPDDVRRSYDLHANAFVTKPVELESFLETVRGIDDFFLGLVTLPRT
ncbi:response regulator [Embleya sp. NBC_00896]|uniref:response regulator n=1 Tax=Embleya sp. NBC_00896 TaxID=2975961 RepID=UPI00386A84D5|nr:response regulator [Embleya sp. NBC_00896]